MKHLILFSTCLTLFSCGNETSKTSTPEMNQTDSKSKIDSVSDRQNDSFSVLREEGPEFKFEGTKQINVSVVLFQKNGKIFISKTGEKSTSETADGKVSSTLVQVAPENDLITPLVYFPKNAANVKMFLPAKVKDKKEVESIRSIITKSHFMDTCSELKEIYANYRVSKFDYQISKVMVHNKALYYIDCPFQENSFSFIIYNDKIVHINGSQMACSLSHFYVFSENDQFYFPHINSECGTDNVSMSVFEISPSGIKEITGYYLGM